jgi:hypothetical protein
MLMGCLEVPSEKNEKRTLTVELGDVGSDGNV